MQVKSSLKNLAISPIKLGIVAGIVRGERVTLALQKLRLVDKKGAKMVYKCLLTAVDGAVKNQDAAEENLKIKEIWVSPGDTSLRRFRFAAKGRIRSYRKHRANLYIVVSNGSEN